MIKFKTASVSEHKSIHMVHVGTSLFGVLIVDYDYNHWRVYNGEGFLVEAGILDEVKDDVLGSIKLFLEDILC